jgi:CBS domain-containing protein
MSLQSQIGCFTPTLPQENAMKVSEAMSRDVRTVSPDQTIAEAAQIMAEIDAGSLPVGENDRLVGMVTDRDIAVRGVAKKCSPDTKVRDVMSADVKYCYDDEALGHVAKNMGEIQVRRLPVVNREKRLVGIISLGDIATDGNSRQAAETIRKVSTPGGQHSQSMAGIR